ncbi:protein of unknown function [Sulfitobacter brevis]|uniref:DUF4440 domain-containing protein n=1 Tax=Sulfitobacter brevis TaxID=74348 RepID=A0A1I2D6C0_9RHOB|nr:nuclear transport factor 2 family protein [Sulfitobacter brevis]SFE76077.1 protein of unknown function [Sulfitobacter brevis]
MNDTNDTKETITALERAVWNALVEANTKADHALLASDFLGVHSDGFATKQDHTSQLADGPSVAWYEFESVQVRRLGTDHALISYRADFRRPDETGTETMYVSSIWEQTATGWLNIFSQDSPKD